MSIAAMAADATLKLQQSRDARAARSNHESKPQARFPMSSRRIAMTRHFRSLLSMKAELDERLKHMPINSLATKSDLQIYKIIRALPKLPTEILILICELLSGEWLRYFRFMHTDPRLRSVVDERLFGYDEVRFLLVPAYYLAGHHLITDKRKEPYVFESIDVFILKEKYTENSDLPMDFKQHLMRHYVKEIKLLPTAYQGMTGDRAARLTASDTDQYLHGIESLEFAYSWNPVALEMVLFSLKFKVKRIRYGDQEYRLSYHKSATNAKTQYDLLLNRNMTKEIFMNLRPLQLNIRWRYKRSPPLSSYPTHFKNMHYDLRNLTISGLCTGTCNLTDLLRCNETLQSFRLENATLRYESYETDRNQICCPFWELLDAIRKRWGVANRYTAQLEANFINVSKLGWEGSVTLHHSDLVAAWCSKTPQDIRDFYNAHIVKQLGSLSLPSDIYVMEATDIKPDPADSMGRTLVLEYKATKYFNSSACDSKKQRSNGEGPRRVWQMIKSKDNFRMPGPMISGIFPHIKEKFIIVYMAKEGRHGPDCFCNTIAAFANRAART